MAQTQKAVVALNGREVPKEGAELVEQLAQKHRLIPKGFGGAGERVGHPNAAWVRALIAGVARRVGQITAALGPPFY